MLAFPAHGQFLDGVKKTLDDLDRTFSKGLGTDTNRPAAGTDRPAPADLNDRPGVVRSVQARLNELGYAAGPVDGLYGRATRTAILSFQRDNALPATGNVTATLLAQLKDAPARGDALTEPVAKPAVPQRELAAGRPRARPGAADTLSDRGARFGSLFHATRSNGAGHRVDYYVDAENAGPYEGQLRFTALHHTDVRSPLVPFAVDDRDGFRKIRYADNHVAFFRDELLPAIQARLGDRTPTRILLIHYVKGLERQAGRDPQGRLDMARLNDAVLRTGFRYRGRVVEPGGAARAPYAADGFAPIYVPDDEVHVPGDWTSGGWLQDDADPLLLTNTYEDAIKVRSGAISVREIDYAGGSVPDTGKAGTEQDADGRGIQAASQAAPAGPTDGAGPPDAGASMRSGPLGSGPADRPGGAPDDTEEFRAVCETDTGSAVRHYDCGCVADRYAGQVQMRTTGIRAPLTRMPDLQDLDLADCTSKAKIDDSLYAECITTGNWSRLLDGQNLRAVCACTANAYAQLFDHYRPQPTDRTVDNLRSRAATICEDPVIAKRVHPRDYRIVVGGE